MKHIKVKRIKPLSYLDARARFTHKRAIRKDRAGVGALLEMIGLVVVIFTFTTIIGPLIGVLLIACGFSIARQKRYVCVRCGNDMSKESKVCPACDARYDK